MKLSAFIFVIALIVIANIGACLFGFNFKIGILILILSLWIAIAILIRKRKRHLADELRKMDEKDLENFLAELSVDERKEILEMLGRNKN